MELAFLTNVVLQLLVQKIHLINVGITLVNLIIEIVLLRNNVLHLNHSSATMVLVCLTEWIVYHLIFVQKIVLSNVQIYHVLTMFQVVILLQAAHHLMYNVQRVLVQLLKNNVLQLHAHILHLINVMMDSV
jgi:hypothetical protein